MSRCHKLFLVVSVPNWFIQRRIWAKSQIWVWWTQVHWACLLMTTCSWKVPQYNWALMSWLTDRNMNLKLVSLSRCWWGVQVLSFNKGLSTPLLRSFIKDCSNSPLQSSRTHCQYHCVILLYVLAWFSTEEKERLTIWGLNAMFLSPLALMKICHVTIKIDWGQFEVPPCICSNA